MRIAILVEGKTERVFIPFLRAYLRTKLLGQMPKLDLVPFDGGLPKGDKLRRIVTRLRSDRRTPADAVIALTDVYPEYQNANDAKQKLAAWVGDDDHFFPHVALHDFEAWLLPYWEKIQQLTGSNRSKPGNHPETVNHNNPPSKRLAEIYRTGSKTKSYKKTSDPQAILQGEDLLVAINACPELKALINRILTLCEVTDEELLP